ncbi:hypothetical protein XM38_015830 [Halomicronema hongdechloris C2206]|uniref:KH domain-containing protein n=1 Tax=Halomicronema hongdechloris C2206 TaxID=1641165 RepID=A0A1Z3HK22_9CYAN|nr:KH domain-containing protein [Halomicronema hongdechloris]ASC70643.1 hypothetical protein XM38_015830 [Halomicronema hongdechloris C2206]
MSSNSFVPNPDEASLSDQVTGDIEPNFDGLVRFLIGPFLESPGALSVDCEYSANHSRLLIRVAFESEDRGRVFGRGGRNIQAIRSVIMATAKRVNLQAHLDVYGEPQHHESSSDQREASSRRRPRRRPPRSKSAE